MKDAKLKDFVRGWFVGNFEPSLLKTNDVEIAYKSYKVGDTELRHFHKIANEITLITKGIVIMNGKEFCAGDIIIMEPEDIADFKVVEDTESVVVKIPGANNDKYEVEE